MIEALKNSPTPTITLLFGLSYCNKVARMKQSDDVAQSSRWRSDEAHFEVDEIVLPAFPGR